MIDTATANTLLTVASSYRHAGRPLPKHVAADLQELAGEDEQRPEVRAEARRLLSLEQERHQQSRFHGWLKGRP